MVLRADLSGRKFGRLTPVSSVDMPTTSASVYPGWVCTCDCGGSSVVRSGCLIDGTTKSCGCLAKEGVTARNLTHGMSRLPECRAEYTAWHMMKQRCLNPTAKNFHYYGGRGITVCARWLHGDGTLSGFECFLADIGRKPSPKLSLDRWPNNDGNYEPGNCRWATAKEQANNRRARRARRTNP